MEAGSRSSSGPSAEDIARLLCSAFHVAQNDAIRSQARTATKSLAFSQSNKKPSNSAYNQQVRGSEAHNQTNSRSVPSKARAERGYNEEKQIYSDKDNSSCHAAEDENLRQDSKKYKCKPVQSTTRSDTRKFVSQTASSGQDECPTETESESGSPCPSPRDASQQSQEGSPKISTGTQAQKSSADVSTGRQTQKGFHDCSNAADYRDKSENKSAKRKLSAFAVCSSPPTRKQPKLPVEQKQHNKPCASTSFLPSPSAKQSADRDVLDNKGLLSQGHGAVRLSPKLQFQTTRSVSAFSKGDGQARNTEAFSTTPTTPKTNLPSCTTDFRQAAALTECDDPDAWKKQGAADIGSTSDRYKKRKSMSAFTTPSNFKWSRGPSFTENIPPVSPFRLPTSPDASICVTPEALASSGIAPALWVKPTPAHPITFSPPSPVSLLCLQKTSRPCGSLAKKAPALPTKESPALAVTESPALVSKESPALAAKELPVLVTKKSPALVTALAVKKSPAFAVNKSPALLSKESPALAVKKSRALAVTESPAFVTKRSPALVFEKSPALAVKESPAVVSKQSPVLVVKKSPALAVKKSSASAIKKSPAPAAMVTRSSPQTRQARKVAQQRLKTNADADKKMTRQQVREAKKVGGLKGKDEADRDGCAELDLFVNDEDQSNQNCLAAGDVSKAGQEQGLSQHAVCHDDLMGIDEALTILREANANAMSLLQPVEAGNVLIRPAFAIEDTLSLAAYEDQADLRMSAVSPPRHTKRLKVSQDGEVCLVSPPTVDKAPRSLMKALFDKPQAPTTAIGSDNASDKAENVVQQDISGKQPKENEEARVQERHSGNVPTISALETEFDAQHRDTSALNSSTDVPKGTATASTTPERSVGDSAAQVVCARLSPLTMKPAVEEPKPKRLLTHAVERKDRKSSTCDGKAPKTGERVMFSFDPPKAIPTKAAPEPASDDSKFKVPLPKKPATPFNFGTSDRAISASRKSWTVSSFVSSLSSLLPLPMHSATSAASPVPLVPALREHQDRIAGALHSDSLAKGQEHSKEAVDASHAGDVTVTFAEVMIGEQGESPGSIEQDAIQATAQDAGIVACTVHGQGTLKDVEKHDEMKDDIGEGNTICSEGESRKDCVHRSVEESEGITINNAADVFSASSDTCASDSGASSLSEPKAIAGHMQAAEENMQLTGSHFASHLTDEKSAAVTLLETCPIDQPHNSMQEKETVHDEQRESGEKAADLGIVAEDATMDEDIVPCSQFRLPWIGQYAPEQPVCDSSSKVEETSDGPDEIVDQLQGNSHATYDDRAEVCHSAACDVESSNQSGRGELAEHQEDVSVQNTSFQEEGAKECVVADVEKLPSEQPDETSRNQAEQVQEAVVPDGTFSADEVDDDSFPSSIVPTSLVARDNCQEQQFPSDVSACLDTEQSPEGAVLKEGDSCQTVPHKVEPCMHDALQPNMQDCSPPPIGEVAPSTPASVSCPPSPFSLAQEPWTDSEVLQQVDSARYDSEMHAQVDSQVQAEADMGVGALVDSGVRAPVDSDVHAEADMQVRTEAVLASSQLVQTGQNDILQRLFEIQPEHSTSDACVSVSDGSHAIQSSDDCACNEDAALIMPENNNVAQWHIEQHTAENIANSIDMDQQRQESEDEEREAEKLSRAQDTEIRDAISEKGVTQEIEPIVQALHTSDSGQSDAIVGGVASSDDDGTQGEQADTVDESASILVIASSLLRTDNCGSAELDETNVVEISQNGEGERLENGADAADDEDVNKDYGMEGIRTEKGSLTIEAGESRGVGNTEASHEEADKERDELVMRLDDGERQVNVEEMRGEERAREMKEQEVTVGEGEREVNMEEVTGEERADAERSGNEMITLEYGEGKVDEEEMKLGEKEGEVNDEVRHKDGGEGEVNAEEVRTEEEEREVNMEEMRHEEEQSAVNIKEIRHDDGDREVNAEEMSVDEEGRDVNVEEIRHEEERKETNEGGMRDEESGMSGDEGECDHHFDMSQHNEGMLVLSSEENRRLEESSGECKNLDMYEQSICKETVESKHVVHVHGKEDEGSFAVVQLEHIVVSDCEEDVQMTTSDKAWETGDIGLKRNQNDVDEEEVTAASPDAAVQANEGGEEETATEPQIVTEQEVAADEEVVTEQEMAAGEEIAAEEEKSAGQEIAEEREIATEMKIAAEEEMATEGDMAAGNQNADMQMQVQPRHLATAESQVCADLDISMSVGDEMEGHEPAGIDALVPFEQHAGSEALQGAVREDDVEHEGTDDGVACEEAGEYKEAADGTLEDEGQKEEADCDAREKAGDDDVVEGAERKGEGDHEEAKVVAGEQEGEHEHAEGAVHEEESKNHESESAAREQEGEQGVTDRVASEEEAMRAQAEGVEADEEMSENRKKLEEFYAFSYESAPADDRMQVAEGSHGEIHVDEGRLYEQQSNSMANQDPQAAENEQIMPSAPLEQGQRLEEVMPAAADSDEDYDPDSDSESDSASESIDESDGEDPLHCLLPPLPPEVVIAQLQPESAAWAEGVLGGENIEGALRQLHEDRQLERIARNKLVIKGRTRGDMAEIRRREMERNRMLDMDEGNEQDEERANQGENQQGCSVM